MDMNFATSIQPTLERSALCPRLPHSTPHRPFTCLQVARQAKCLHAESCRASGVDAAEESVRASVKHLAAPSGNLPLRWSPTPCALDRRALQDGKLRFSVHPVFGCKVCSR